MEPNAQEREMIIDMQSLLAWTEMPNVLPPASAAAAPPAPAEAPAEPQTEGADAEQPAQQAHTPLQSFLAWYEAAPTTHFRALGTLTVNDFAEELLTWRVNGQRPSVRARACAKLAHVTARRLCKLEPWPSAEAPTPITTTLATADGNGGGTAAEAAVMAREAEAQRASAGSNLVPASTSTTKLLNVQTIKLDDVLDQRLNAEITYIPETEVIRYNARYREVMDEACDEECKPTLEQLSALAHILGTARPPYADFSVFGPHGTRFQKRKKLSGLVPDSKGQLHMVEMFGPPDLTAWTSSYNVFFSAAVMMNIVTRSRLARYAKKISNLAALYGPSTWHLLYQADVRCRSEHMEHLKFLLIEQHNADLIAHRRSDFNADMPWDSVWQAAIDDKDYWEKEFTVNATMILNKVKSMNDVLKGDAPAAHKDDSSASSQLYAPDGIHLSQNQLQIPPQPRGQKRKQQPPSRKQSASRPCSNFMSGNCTAGMRTGPGQICAADPNCFHPGGSCNRCGSAQHHASACPSITKSSGTKGRGKGRGRGKGYGRGKF